VKGAKCYVMGGKMLCDGEQNVAMGSKMLCDGGKMLCDGEQNVM
jgi:hypothetical protein